MSKLTKEFVEGFLERYDGDLSGPKAVTELRREKVNQELAQKEALQTNAG